jgi:hypothetical protein
MTIENAIFLGLVLWKIGQWVVPCILLGFGATWLLKKGGIDL